MSNPAFGKWTRIDEQLPPQNTHIITCCLIDREFTEWESGYWNGQRAISGALVIETYSDDWVPATHWMPGPELPSVITEAGTE